MLKACTLFYKLESLSRDEAGSYWRTTHAALVRRLPGVRRYVQCQPLEVAKTASEFPFDGFAEF